MQKDETSPKPAKEKHPTAAFVNWTLTGKNGKTLKSSRGFQLQGHPEYPNKQEDVLIELARKAAKAGLNGYDATLTVNIQLNNSTQDYDVDDFFDELDELENAFSEESAI